MESMRASSSGYFPAEVADELERDAGSPYTSAGAADSLPAAAAYAAEQASAMGALTAGQQTTYLRAGHYTVVAARPGELVHQDDGKDGEASFCVQAVGAFAGEGGTELEVKAVASHELEFISPEQLSGASYQLSHGGDVYKLVMRDPKPGEVSAEQLAAHYGHQLLPDGTAVVVTGAGTVEGHVEGHVEEHATDQVVDHVEEHAGEHTVDHSAELEQKVILTAAAPPPPPPHCLICDLRLANHTVLDIFSNTTHQTSTTYAIKLRQVTGHRANFAYHSDVLCESCASLLNVVDSFEARLREIKTRLDDTRAEVQSKFSRTCARYDEAQLTEPVVEPPPPVVVEAEIKVQGKKRKAEDVTPPLKRKKTPGRTAGVVKDKPYKDKSRATVATAVEDAASTARRRRPVRRTAERSRVLVEADDDNGESIDDPAEADNPSDHHFLEPSGNGDGEGDHGGRSSDDVDVEAGGDADDGDDSPTRRRCRLLNRCPHCHVVQDNIHAFRAHLASHTALSADAVAEHLTQKVNERLAYACSRCPARFWAYREQQRHVRGRHAPFSRCPVCLTQVEEEGDLLQRHLEAHQPPERCSFCSTQVDTVAELCRHTEREHPLALRSLYCELCRVFVDETAMAAHIRAEHPSVPELRVQCRRCGELVRRAALAAHTRVHEQSHRCKFCSRAFPSAATLVVHERTHTGERPFWCADCRKSYISKATLDAHVIAFHRTNQYECGKCSRSYTSASRLKRHQLIHSDTKPFVCQVCQKGFSLENHLNLHVRAIHLGETPHECHVCHKRFPYKSSLKDHVHVHTGDKSHCCATCGKSFRTAKILRSHSFTHRTEKPYKCDFRLCTASFSRKDLLARHRLSSHGIAPDVRYSRLQGRAAVAPPQPAPAPPPPPPPLQPEVHYVLSYQPPPPPPRPAHPSECQ